MSKDRSEHYAFARGYFDGREKGEESNPFDSETQAKMHQLYRDGYDWGVTDYCLEHHASEVNT